LTGSSPLPTLSVSLPFGYLFCKSTYSYNRKLSISTTVERIVSPVEPGKRKEYLCELERTKGRKEAPHEVRNRYTAFATGLCIEQQDRFPRDGNQIVGTMLEDTPLMENQRILHRRVGDSNPPMDSRG